MPPALAPPCPQAASGGTLPPAPVNPLLFGIEQVAPQERPAPPPGWLFDDYSDDPAWRWPFHLPFWNAVDCLWWLCLGRAVYWEDSTWVERVARWSGQVQRIHYAPPLAPPAVGHAFIEMVDQWLCVVPGTNSDPERNAYLLGHALELLSTDPVGNWSVNSQWYTRALTVYQAAVAWGIPDGKPVVAIGHSSGGAEGAVACVKFGDRSNASTSHVVTFGSPRWSSPSLNDAITLHKRPQVIEFSLPGDPVPLVPPPWSVVDALRLRYNLTPRPEYLRPGAILDLMGAAGVTPRQSSAGADAYEAARQVLSGNLGTGQHDTGLYTRTAMAWAQSHCAENGSSAVIAGLVELVAQMDAAGV